MIRTLFAFGLALGAFTSVSLAEPLELNDTQMDALTAGDASITQSNSFNIAVTAGDVSVIQSHTSIVTTSEDATVNQIAEELLSLTLTLPDALWTRVVVEVLSQQRLSH